MARSRNVGDGRVRVHVRGGSGGSELGLGCVLWLVQDAARLLDHRGAQVVRTRREECGCTGRRAFAAEFRHGSHFIVSCSGQRVPCSKTGKQHMRLSSAPRHGRMMPSKLSAKAFDQRHVDSG